MGVFDETDYYFSLTWNCFLSYFALLFVTGFTITIICHKSILSFIFMKKQLNTSRHGGELVAEVLKAHKVKHIFTLTGGHISPVLVGAEKVGIQVIDTRHEVTAVYAADAVARLTSNIGVAVVTAGPGVTNTVTAVKNAQMAQSAILLIGGAAPTLLKGRGALQDIDQLSLFKSLCKYCRSVQTVRDIVPVIRKAIQIAMSGTPGPVFVEIPVNILYPLELVQKEVGKNMGNKSLFSWIVNWYLDWHVYNIFVDGFQTTNLGPLPVRVPLASDTEVKCAARMLQDSSKPVILFGSQAVLPAASAENLKAAVIELGIPCFLGGMARGLLGRNCPLLLRHTRRDVLKEADLVILAGSICDFRLSYGKVLSKRSVIIAVNRSKEHMLKNSDMFWKPTLSVEGCVSDFIIRLKNLKNSSHTRKIDSEWISHISQRDNAKETNNRKKALEIPGQHLNPLKVLYDFEDSLDHNDDIVFVADGGDFVATASYILRPRGPLRWLDPGPFGTLGVGAGFALGAKLCYPSMNVVILYGDGSLGYSLMEFDTFSRHKLPVYAVVGNDACWTQIARDQVPLFKSNVACSLNYSNYHQTAESLGGKGILIKSEDRDNIQQLFKCVFEEPQYRGNSVLVNVLITPTSFREGSLSV